ncbi:MAG: hypothetical protein ACRDTX_12280 [Pseudonocardiaceae bacterium]
MARAPGDYEDTLWPSQRVLSAHSSGPPDDAAQRTLVDHTRRGFVAVPPAAPAGS